MYNNLLLFIYPILIIKNKNKKNFLDLNIKFIFSRFLNKLLIIYNIKHNIIKIIF